MKLCYLRLETRQKILMVAVVSFGGQGSVTKELVREGGLEPPPSYGQASETCVSTSSTTRAKSK